MIDDSRAWYLGLAPKLNAIVHVVSCMWLNLYQMCRVSFCECLAVSLCSAKTLLSLFGKVAYLQPTSCTPREVLLLTTQHMALGTACFSLKL